MEKTFICSREKFLELKQIQKRIARSRKLENKDYRNYVKYRRQYYHSKGMQVPNAETADSGFVYVRKPITLETQEPRYFNVFYGIVRGRSYAQIEPHVREEHRLESGIMYQYCIKYGVPYAEIERAIWQTS